VGLAVGFVGGAALRRLALPSSALLSLGVLALAVGSYAVAASMHASGFLAVYVAALVLGNAHLPHRTAVRGFAESLGWLAQIGLFVLLGLLASPEHMNQAWRSQQLVALGSALVLGLVLLLVARPLSVVVSMTPFRLPWRHQAFVSWAGLRGAVPVVLATVPISAMGESARWIFDLVFVLVVVFTLVQAPLLPFFARRLSVGNVVDSRDLDLESAPLETLDADVVQVRVGETSRMHGLEVFELRLPPGANVTLVVRDGTSFVPDPRTVLRRNDQLLVVATSAVRPDVLRRLRAVSRGGRLAVWEQSGVAERTAGRTAGRTSGAGAASGGTAGGTSGGTAGGTAGRTGGWEAGRTAGRQVRPGAAQPAGAGAAAGGRWAGLRDGRLAGLLRRASRRRPGRSSGSTGRGQGGALG
jgi:cell volume regulation protein A